MRLDLFLKISRLMPRRSVAQEFCDAGMISVNGTPAKSSKEVKAGDEILVRRRNRVLKVAIKALPATKQVAKSQAGELYEILEETSIEDDIFN